MAEAPNTEKTAFSRKVRSGVFGISLHSWEQLMLLSLGATGLVAIGVALTTTSVVILQRHETAEAKRELEEYKLTVESKVADAKKEGIAAGKAAGDALLRAAELERQSEQLRKDTAEANARAIEAQLALEKFKAPRTLSAEQQVAMTAKLKKFAGTAFDVAIGPMGDPEPLYLARAIHSALTLAGWSQIAWVDGGLVYTESPMLAIGTTSVTNVIVDVHPNHWEKFGIAASELAMALAAAGVEAITDSKPTSRQTEAIHLRIGRKL